MWWKVIVVAAVSVEHTGTFNMSETGEQWKPFKSTQRIITIGYEFAE